MHKAISIARIFIKYFIFFIFTLNIAPSNNIFVTCTLPGQLGNKFFLIATMLAYAWDNNLEPIIPVIENALGGKENLLYFHKLFKSFSSINEYPNRDWNTLSQNTQDGHIYKELSYLTNKNVNLVGYFQSCRYFDKYRTQILELFQLPLYKQTEIQEKFKNIFSHPNTVAVHIRTGDFSRQQWKVYFPGLDFYYRKMATFDKDNTLFVVCSDRINWVKEKFKDWPFNIIYPDSDHITEFYLMTQCKHMIASIYSTFAFWAAYLNTNPNKTILAHNVTDVYDWYPRDWDVESFRNENIYYPDMGFYDNKSLDND